MARARGVGGPGSLKVVRLASLSRFVKERRARITTIRVAWGGRWKGSALQQLQAGSWLSDLARGKRTVAGGTHQDVFTTISLRRFLQLRLLALVQEDGRMVVTPEALLRLERLERCFDWKGARTLTTEEAADRLRKAQRAGFISEGSQLPVGKAWLWGSPNDPYGPSRPRGAMLRNWVAGYVATNWRPFPAGVVVRIDDVLGAEEKALGEGHTIGKYRGRVYVMNVGPAARGPGRKRLRVV